MAYRHFPTRNAAWLTAELEKCEEELARGATITEGSAGDSSSKSLVQAGITSRMAMLKHDLCVLDPDTWAEHIGDTATTYGSP